jgi:hypothetical protein
MPRISCDLKGAAQIFVGIEAILSFLVARCRFGATYGNTGHVES